MHESNQGSEESRTGPQPAPGAPEPIPGAPEAGAVPPPLPDAAWSEAIETTSVAAPPAPAQAGPAIMPGLWMWFGLIAALGVVGVVFGQAEMAMAATLAGAFAAAHAADRDPTLDRLHQVLMAMLIVGAAMVFGGLAFWIATETSRGMATKVAVGLSAGAGVLCLLSGLRFFSNPLATVLFRTATPNHVLRLSARLVLMVLLFAFPAWVAFPKLLDMIVETGKPLISTSDLYGNLVGLIVLALGGVGFLVRRDGRQTLDRLGLQGLRPVHWLFVGLGIGALYLLNAGTEMIEQRWFPELWRGDRDVSRMLAGGLGITGSIVLGVSAGAGEELAMRGALQPRLGIVLTSLVFAALHVHYSWFGVGTIFLLGMLLGLIRSRASTTVAILVHALYDMTVVLTTGKS